MEMHRFENEKFQHPAMSFSPDSSHLAVSEFPGVHIWDVSTYKQLLSFSDPHSYVTGVCFSADGKLIATTLDSGGTGWNGAGRIRIYGPGFGLPRRKQAPPPQ
jgi:WD40 repeat protein